MASFVFAGRAPPRRAEPTPSLSSPYSTSQGLASPAPSQLILVGYVGLGSLFSMEMMPSLAPFLRVIPGTIGNLSRLKFLYLDLPDNDMANPPRKNHGSQARHGWRRELHAWMAAASFPSTPSDLRPFSVAPPPPSASRVTSRSSSSLEVACVIQLEPFLCPNRPASSEVAAAQPFEAVLVGQRAGGDRARRCGPTRPACRCSVRGQLCLQCSSSDGFHSFGDRVTLER
ncbi:hypothetical protein EJB05_25745, partial [Eragrostis curvula]